MAESYTKFKGGQIAYSSKGEGKVIVLLHGFLENKNMWVSWVNELSKKYKLIIPDLPGHGNSDCFGYVHSMELMAEAVISVLKHEKIRKALVIGHSMGGYVAMALADLYPDLLKGLCLYHSTARPDSEDRKIGRDQAVELVKQNHKSFVRKAIPLLFRYKFRSIYKEKIGALKKEALDTSKQGIIAALKGMKERPNREIIFKFPPYPCLLLGGKHDHLIPFKTLMEQASLSENVQAIGLQEAGHMSFIEEPIHAYNWVSRWLNQQQY